MEAGRKAVRPPAASPGAAGACARGRDSAVGSAERQAEVDLQPSSNLGEWGERLKTSRAEPVPRVLRCKWPKFFGTFFVIGGAPGERFVRLSYGLRGWREVPALGPAGGRRGGEDRAFSHELPARDALPAERRRLPKQRVCQLRDRRDPAVRAG